MITIKNDIILVDTPTIQDIPIGTAFVGQILTYKGLFLKVHDGLVLLDSPNHTWNNTSAKLDKYIEVDIEITAKVRNANNNS